MNGNRRSETISEFQALLQGSEKMKFRSLLIQRCTLIHRNQKTGEDDYGQDIYEDVEVNNIPCRIDQIRQAASYGQTGTDYLISNVLYLDKDMKVSMDMIVRDLKDKKGNVILEGSFVADAVLPVYDRSKLHHFEITLRKG